MRQHQAGVVCCGGSLDNRHSYLSSLHFRSNPICQVPLSMDTGGSRRTNEGMPNRLCTVLAMKYLLLTGYLILRKVDVSFEKVPLSDSL